MKAGLNSKSGIRKWLHAREYHRIAQSLYREANVVFACDLSYHTSYYFHYSLYRIEAMTDCSFSLKQVHHRYLVGFTFALTAYVNLTAHGLDDIYHPVIKTARSLYRCWLSCKDAFPSSDMEYEWVVGVWNEACFRTETSPNMLRPDEEACLFFVTCGPASLGFQITCSSMMFLAYMKAKIKHAVESSYEFDTSQSPDSISRNFSRSQALLAKTTFIYRVRLIASPFAAN
jgi:hypothetical protein